jgi:hypothetical protein
MEFNERIAVIYGVEEAVMIHNLWWWVKTNRANNRHCFEGKFWTYNSIDAFAALFKFWSVRQVRRIIESCAKKGAIEIGNFNSSGYNRTNWYTVSAEIEAVYVSENLHLPKSTNAFVETDKSISQNRQMDLPKTTNGFAENDKCITDINHIVNTNNKPDREGALKFLEVNFPSKLEAEMMKYKTALGTEYEKFCADFDDTITIELSGGKISWEGNALIARLGKYARSWVSNMQSKAAQGKGFNVSQQTEVVTRNRLV